MSEHVLRAHSRFSASGSERWLNCAASVELEDGCPNTSSPWAEEGTKAHELLEQFLLASRFSDVEIDFLTPPEMVTYVKMTALKIKALAVNKTLLVEKKVFNTFIHEEMFGTCDVIIADYENNLHIVDFKYGKGHIVTAANNTQLIQYALGAAESYNWKFKTVTMSIAQPRAGEKWFSSWTIPMSELKSKWLNLWHSGVKRVIKGGNKPFEGHWCQWCKAKFKCPAKSSARLTGPSNPFLNLKD